MQIITTYPPWFLIFCLLFGAGVSALLYYRSKQLSDFSRGLILFLSVLRFIVVSLLAFFLLEPMLKLIRQEIEKPVIVIGIDNSESMMMSADSTSVQELIHEQLADLESSLSGDYELRTYSFGEQVNETPEFDFTEKETDISAFLNEIQNRYSNRNLGAVIIASDGLYNRGLNPVHQTTQLRAPVYSIAIGDTTPQRDIVISEVVHNELAYLGNDFPIEVMVEARGFSGEGTAVSIHHRGREIAQEIIRFDGDAVQLPVRFLLEAAETGIQQYTITAHPLEGEFTTGNNVHEMYIEVLDSQQKILMIANAPHPDIRAIRLAVEANENYAFEFRLADETIPPLKEFHLVIFHGLPSDRHNIANIRSEINSGNIPAWFILTKQTDLKTFNTWETGVNVKDARGNSNASGAAFNGTFSLFNLDAEVGNYFGSLPPLNVPFGEYQTTAQGQILMYQRIGSVRTEFPLWAFFDQNDWKTAVLSGEGLWRWRTMSYADRGSHNTFNSLVHKTVQYLASRDNKQFLRVSGAKSFRENEDIIFRAETYNKSYELTTDPEVQMVITDAEDRSFEFNFSRSGNAYRLNAGHLPAGNYTYRVTADAADEQHIATGAFSVIAVNIESVHITANHQMLYQISSSTNGEIIYGKDVSSLADKIHNSRDIASVVYERKELADLINLRWIFFVMLALFATEWFIRKRQGAY